MRLTIPTHPPLALMNLAEYRTISNERPARALSVSSRCVQFEWECAGRPD